MANVLIIDDDHDVTRLLELHLTEEGHGVTVTHDGKEGMSQVLKKTPDLIMLDVFLPDATGYQMCNRIRKNEATKETPIIMMTGAARFPNQQMYGRQRGANEYIFKPFDIVQVGELVQKYIKSTAPAQPAPQPVAIVPVVPEMESQTEQDPLVMISAFLQKKASHHKNTSAEIPVLNFAAHVPKSIEPLIPMNPVPVEPRPIELKIKDQRHDDPTPEPIQEHHAPAPVEAADPEPVTSPTPAPMPMPAPVPVSMPIASSTPLTEPLINAAASAPEAAPVVIVQMPIPPARPGYIAASLGAKDRFHELSMDIIALATRLCSTNAEKHIADQLLRTSLAVGAKLNAAQFSASPEEFAQHAGGALRDLRETAYWLIIVKKIGLLDKLTRTDLEKTCQSLITLLSDYAKKA